MVRKISVAVDAVIFTVIEQNLKILLIKRKNVPLGYALPGGFVEENESLDEAAKRELMHETGVKNIFLKQLGAYGDVRRDPRGRVVSVAFMAIISPDQRLEAATDAASAEWHSAYSLPKLVFDHERIISDALKQLRYEIQTTNIAFQILPKQFTFLEFQTLYELVLEKTLDKRNFRKRINELGILKETSGTRMEGAHRPAKLYSFKHDRYSSLREKINIFLK